MSYLELRGISKIYGEGATEVRALDRVDLFVDAGSLVAVMGSSGSGKSTLLTIAGSLEDPSSGEVSIGGRSLASLSRNGKARLRRQSIGYVFQDYNLLPGLTVAENASLPLELDGIAVPKARAAGTASPVAALLRRPSAVSNHRISESSRNSSASTTSAKLRSRRDSPSFRRVHCCMSSTR